MVGGDDDAHAPSAKGIFQPITTGYDVAFPESSGKSDVFVRRG
jgi:hypothetical protein